MYTRHGWHIEGTIPFARPSIAPAPLNCGGVEGCDECKVEAGRIQNYSAKGLVMQAPREDRPEMLSDGGFIEEAKRLVQENFYNGNGSGIFAQNRLGLEDIYVVWFCKTLQNWKALVSTNAKDECYYEVTFNGNTSEAYIDKYVKINNIIAVVDRSQEN